MPIFFMTFGCGQPNEGHVLPIVADSEEIARQYMFNTFNGRWCGTYTEDYWEDWKKHARANGCSVEKELPTVVILTVN